MRDQSQRQSTRQRQLPKQQALPRRTHKQKADRQAHTHTYMRYQAHLSGNISVESMAIFPRNRWSWSRSLLQLRLQARRRLSLAPTISIFMQTITPDLRQHRMQMLHYPSPSHGSGLLCREQFPDDAAYGSGRGIGNSNGNGGGVSIFLLRAQHLRYCGTFATGNLQLATGNQQFSS